MGRSARIASCACISHLITIVSLFGLWYFAGLGPIFLAGIVAVSGLLLYEHWLVTPADLTKVNIAFFNVNAVVSIGLLLVGLADIWLQKSEHRGQSPASAVTTISTR